MANNNNKMTVEEEEEVDLRRRLHLFSLVLKNMDMDNFEGASAAHQQQQQNRHHLLAKLEQTLEDVSEGVKRSSWYAKLRLEWAARISQYRSIQNADDAADDELESFFNRGFNKRSEVEMMATTWNYNYHHHHNNNNQEQSAQLIDKASELQPTTLERVTQWLSSLPPSSLNTFVASASASFSSPLLSLEGNNGINSCSSTLADQKNNNQHIQQQQDYFHHHLFYNNCSPVVGTMQSGPAFAPTIQTPLTIRIPTQIQISCPFLLPNTVNSKNGLLPVPRPQQQQQQQQQQRKFPVVAPHHLRLQVFYELSHLPSVTLPIQLSILNRLFIDVACIARWIFPYLDDRHFQTAIFEAAFAKLPATLQAKFRAQCSATPRGQGQAGKLKAKQIVNLIAFLRICVRGQMVRTRAAMSRQAVKKENWRKLQKSPPPRFCAFCKLYTTHDIVSCPLRVFDICHRCFQHGHNFRHCVNPPLLPLAWLNSGLISYEQEVFEQ